MYFNKIIINYILIGLCVYNSKSKSTGRANRASKIPLPKLLIISFDGFRNDYFNRNITNYLNNLRLSGTYTDYMTNVFPTKTFPNHHSIATGLNADIHGVTANSVYDRKLNHKLNYTQLFDYDSDHVTPIWILNQKSGSNRYCGCMMWPGSENQYQNETCHFIQSFTYKMPFEDRVDQMMKWFTDAATPINLGLLYFEEPDSSAHVYGPDSIQVNDVVRKINNLTKYIEEKLIEFGLSDVNVIYLSDHGMDTVLVRNIIDLNNFIKNDTYKYYGTSPVLQIVPNNASELDMMHKTLSIAAKNNGNFTVYLNSDLPKRWHIQNDQRFGPITVLANEGYGFQDLFIKVKEYQEKDLIPSGPIPNHTLGTHGYDNALTNMHSFFMARGPNILANTRVPPFNTLELYGVFCQILDLVPPITTNLNIVVDLKQLMETKASSDKIKSGSSNTLIFYGIAIIIFLSIILLAIVGIRFFMTRRRRRDLHIQNVSEKSLENQHLMVTHFSETED